MKLRMRLKNLNYGDVALLLLPKLREKSTDDSAISRMMQAVINLPEAVIYQLFDAIPEEEKNAIVAALSAENHQRILDFLQNYMEENGYGITLEDFTVNDQLELEILIKEIDFVSLAKVLLPRLTKQGGEEGETSVLLGILRTVPQSMWMSVLLHIPQEQRISTGVYLLNHGGHAICGSMTEWLRKKGVSVTVTGLAAEK